MAETTEATIKQNFLEATVSTIVAEMRRDESVFVMGEDIREGIYGAYPIEELGERIRGLPISETANAGMAVGAALTGLRPVLDMTITTFLYSAMDQIVNQAAKGRYLFGGQAKVPVVIRSAMFYGASQAAHHNDRPYAMFAHAPGLKITIPSSPVNAAGLMRTAIRSDDPVLVFEDSNLWGARGDVPTDPDFMIPFGEAEVRREGTDVTIIGIANATRFVTQAAGDLEKKGISAEVIDPRTLVPFDWETIFASVEKTRRLVVVDPAPLTCSFASEISATVSERLHDSLHVPVVRVTGPDCHVAFSPPLERAVLPTRQKVVEVVERVVNKIPAQA